MSETRTFLRTAEREFLIGDVALQDFDEAARFFARHDGGDVDLGEDALGAEGFGEQHAFADIVADGVDVGGEFGVGEALGEQVEGFQDGQAGADQGDELLVEDEEFFEIELLAAAGNADLAGEAEAGAVWALTE